MEIPTPSKLPIGLISTRTILFPMYRAKERSNIFSSMAEHSPEDGTFKSLQSAVEAFDVGNHSLDHTTMFAATGNWSAHWASRFFR